LLGIVKFGIVVCPKCKHPKGVQLVHKTTRCIRCGKMLTLAKLKILYQTDSEEQLRRALGLVNADMEGKRKDFEELLRSQHKTCR